MAGNPAPQSFQEALSQLVAIQQGKPTSGETHARQLLELASRYLNQPIGVLSRIRGESVETFLSAAAENHEVRVPVSEKLEGSLASLLVSKRDIVSIGDASEGEW